MRTRAAVLVAYLAAGSALPATGTAYAAECVKVVVDYGTIAGARAGPNTRCVDVGEDGTAADALRGRARYKGNFLCAIDGYPETGCGDEPPSPYWSFWVWRNGAWAYSNEGVGTFAVGDADGDGHPDPLGFRYHKVDQKAAPRANPSYPKPAPTTTAPPRTTPPRPTAAPASTAPGVPGTTTRAPGGGPTAGAVPGATGTPSATAARIGVSAGPAATATTAPATATSAEGTPEVEAGEIPARRDDGGFPVGAVAGGVLAVGLLGAAAYRFRRPGDA